MFINFGAYFTFSVVFEGAQNDYGVKLVFKRYFIKLMILKTSSFLKIENSLDSWNVFISYIIKTNNNNIIYKFTNIFFNLSLYIITEKN